MKPEALGFPWFGDSSSVPLEPHRRLGGQERGPKQRALRALPRVTSPRVTVFPGHRAARLCSSHDLPPSPQLQAGDRLCWLLAGAGGTWWCLEPHCSPALLLLPARGRPLPLSLALSLGFPTKGALIPGSHVIFDFYFMQMPFLFLKCKINSSGTSHR